MKTSAPIAITAGLTILFAVATNAEAAKDGNNPSKRSDASGPQFKIGESFLVVRGQIIRHGWTPIRMHGNDVYEYDGAEKRLAEHGFFEVDSCSIDGGANCILYYRKKAACLRLETVGEQVKDMRVTRWTSECPT